VACQNAQLNATRRQKRREIDKGDRTSTGFKVNIGILSPQSMQERLRNTIKDRNQLRRNNIRLKANRLVDDANKEFTDDAATLEVFRKTLTNLSSGPMRDKLQRELVGCLIKEFGGEDMKVSVENNGHDEFVDVVLTEIDNYTKKLNGKTTQLRFHPLIMRLAMNLYMSLPLAYMDLQKSTIFALPSESTLKKKKSEHSVKDSKNVTIYMLDSFAHEEKATEPNRIYIGHLECEEFKLKTGLCWKTTSHELIGFADDLTISSIAI
jgi:hypothetical protein